MELMRQCLGKDRHRCIARLEGCVIHVRRSPSDIIACYEKLSDDVVSIRVGLPRPRLRSYQVNGVAYAAMDVLIKDFSGQAYDIRDALISRVPGFA